MPSVGSDGKAALLHPSNLVLDNITSFAVDIAKQYSRIASSMDRLFEERLDFCADLWERRKIATDPSGRPALSTFRYTRNLRHASVPMVELSGGMPVFFAGDALHEPLWLRGEGCSRGFLSGFDTVWTLCQWAKGLRGKVLAEQREKLIDLEAFLDTGFKSNGKDVLLPHMRCFLGIEWGFDGKRRPAQYAYTIDPDTRYVACKQEQKGLVHLLSKVRNAAIFL